MDLCTGCVKCCCWRPGVKRVRRRSERKKRNIVLASHRIARLRSGTVAQACAQEKCRRNFLSSDYAQKIFGFNSENNGEQKAYDLFEEPRNGLPSTKELAYCPFQDFKNFDDFRLLLPELKALTVSQSYRGDTGAGSIFTYSLAGRVERRPKMAGRAAST